MILVEKRIIFRFIQIFIQIMIDSIYLPNIYKKDKKELEKGRSLQQQKQIMQIQFLCV